MTATNCPNCGTPMAGTYLTTDAFGQFIEKSCCTLDPKDCQILALTRRSEYWKAEHLEANKVVDALTRRMEERDAQLAAANEALANAESARQQGWNRANELREALAAEQARVDDITKRAPAILDSMHEDLGDAADFWIHEMRILLERHDHDDLRAHDKALLEATADALGATKEQAEAGYYIQESCSEVRSTILGSFAQDGE